MGSTTWFAMMLPVLFRAGLPAGQVDQSLHVRDDFSRYEAGSEGAPNWLTTSLAWEVRDGAYQFDGPQNGFAVSGEGPVFGKLETEATIRLAEGVGNGWKIAGISIYVDDRNFWHLALVQAPDANAGRHYVELAEMLDGEWLSQTKLQCTAVETPAEPVWDYNTPYRLRIELSEAEIVGVISDTSGKVLYKIAYRFTAPAVKSGRPALHVSGFKGWFDDVAAEGADPTTPPAPPKPPAYEALTTQPMIGATRGVFHVKQMGGVWWVVDPQGRRFYAIGTDHCRYGGHWCEKLGYAPYGRNMERQYGTAEAWAKSATDRLKAWNFNLLGAGGDRAAYYRGLAHTEFAAFGSSFADVSDICSKTTWTGFPNVFHPKWPVFCDRLARSLCASRRDDPWLFGYFLDNELEWYGKTGAQWGLFDEAMKKPADHHAKMALVNFLREHYGRIGDFCQEWGGNMRSFDDLLARNALEDGGKERLRKVKIDFVRLVADRYFAVATAAIRKHDPSHLVIGCRFAGDAPAGIWGIAGKYCDIVSFNYYGNVDLETGEAPGLAERFTSYYEQAKRPLMITEWSFPALDSGLPCKHGAGQRFDTQAQRAQAYGIFQTMVLSLPFMVGSDYFMWVDEPALGISSTFPEDTNYGLVNEQDEAYSDLTETARRVNGRAYDLHERGMDDVAVSGLRQTGTGFEATVANRARRAAEVDLQLTVDGRASTETLRLKAGERRTVREERSWRPGGHFVVAEVDPERKLSEVSRGDNRADLAFYTPGGRGTVFVPRGSVTIPIAIANPGDDMLRDLPVVIRLGKLAKLPWAGIDWSQVYLDGPNEVLPWVQIDPYRSRLRNSSELSFVVPHLAPREVETWFVTVLPIPQERRIRPSPATFKEVDGGFTLSNGRLELRKDKPTGDIIDEIIVDGVTLGRYNPLIWQNPGQDQWVQTDRFEAVEASVGPVRTVLTLTAAASQGQTITKVDDAGRQAERERAPVPFRVTHQVIVYPGRADFEARFVSLENLGDRPLELRGYFFYLLSRIGGSEADDEEASPGAPNYHAGGQGAWRDAKVGWVFGAEAWPGSPLQVSFWRDPGGGQHPDARKQFPEPIVIPPGGKYAEPDAPLLTVYGAKADGAPWRQVARAVRERAAVIVRPSAPGR